MSMFQLGAVKTTEEAEPVHMDSLPGMDYSAAEYVQEIPLARIPRITSRILQLSWHFGNCFFLLQFLHGLLIRKPISKSNLSLLIIIIINKGFRALFETVLIKNLLSYRAAHAGKSTRKSLPDRGHSTVNYRSDRIISYPLSQGKKIVYVG
jgi:hypothetical protein